VVSVQLLVKTASDLQIEAVAKEIRKIISKSKETKQNKLSFKDFMILCPTKNFVTKVAREIKSNFNIPTKLYEKEIIPDDHWRLLLVLRMLHNEDSLALRQWLDIIGLNQDEIYQHRTEAAKNKIDLFTYCKKLSEPTISDLFKRLEVVNNSKDDIELFKKELLAFPHLNVDNTLFPNVGITLDEISKELPSLGTIIQLIYEKFGIFESEFELSDEDSVLVTTMHKAKGLEAEFVFIMWLNLDFLPSPGRNVEEERRVFYVALTRAKIDVILTFHEKFVVNKLLKEQVPKTLKY